MNVSFVTLPETYLSKLRGVNQTCIVFCPNNVDSLPELMSTNCPNCTPMLVKPWHASNKGALHCYRAAKAAMYGIKTTRAALERCTSSRDVVYKKDDEKIFIMDREEQIHRDVS